MTSLRRATVAAPGIPAPSGWPQRLVDVLLVVLPTVSGLLALRTRLGLGGDEPAWLALVDGAGVGVGCLAKLDVNNRVQVALLVHDAGLDGD